MMPDRMTLRTSLLIRRQIGEFAYTAAEISEMLNLAYDGTGLSTPDSDQIIKYALKNQLYFDSSEFEIDKDLSGVKYWIPKSCFGDIINGFDMAVSVRNLEEAIVNLGYQC